MFASTIMTDITSHTTESDLLICAEGGQLVGVSQCLQNGVDLHAKDPTTGQTALHKASVGGHIEMINFLLEHGASVREPDNEGFTPLHLACGAGDQPAVVEALLRRDSFVDAVDGEGMTPLMVAASEGNEEVVGLLLAKGAYLQLTAKDGMTAADLAPKRRIKGLIKAEQGRREEVVLREEGVDAVSVADRWRSAYEARAAQALSQLVTDRTERARIKQAAIEAAKAASELATEVAAAAVAEVDAAAAMGLQSATSGTGTTTSETTGSDLLPRLPKGFHRGHLEGRLQFSRERVYVPWGRQVVQAIAAEDTATLLTIFHEKKHLGADVNAQADIEQVSGCDSGR